MNNSALLSLSDCVKLATWLVNFKLKTAEREWIFLKILSHLEPLGPNAPLDKILKLIWKKIQILILPIEHSLQNYINKITLVWIWIISTIFKASVWKILRILFIIAIVGVSIPWIVVKVFIRLLLICFLIKTTTTDCNTNN